MKHVYSLELELSDLQQILDALESRAAVWLNTLAYARGEEISVDLEVAEFKDVSEAAAVVDHYRELLGRIEKQIALHG
jgi:hypothetical protein